MGDESRSKCRAVCFISGNGTNLQAIIDNINDKALQIDLISVISDNPKAKGLDRAEKEGINTKIIDDSSFQNRKDFDECFEKEMIALNPDLIILAGYMKILSRSFCLRFTGRILNIHPSLLPKYKGLNTHQRVIDDQEELHGASVHFVTPELDDGPVIIQYQFNIENHDDRHSLQEKVQRGEYIIYSKAIQWFSEDRLSFESEKLCLDGAPLSEPRIIKKS
ncbi:MAG: phosphoribosylglycinamide formyltransferase [Gammaproteobacteria bacterium]|jgi:phosphoribosylglycinamide formyltransferase-1|nr:phosphoribosylglycinamide formyltransferase [Gammaproteobacteria bacterium]MBQ09426.1 phosphoribosylglycinamide formyltransferase [Gammaproteobacteria bacterium]MDP6146412.1 phosphoribosylglycinamide formyltransferase [Gammaproteobacteria bacterium]HJL80282.1 phosphoribosylglycinamide formyltransferase [Gammaproteobacteria bacterium]HJM09293.1 phosphoribosylglycinamide formyltransferase [Gammaproteobacteria bacterium]|tara:strand:- start:12560 stop:13222 length:663 start_codon:yes stop_codon:yes gene_type:complete